MVLITGTDDCSRSECTDTDRVDNVDQCVAVILTSHRPLHSKINLVTNYNEIFMLRTFCMAIKIRAESLKLRFIWQEYFL